MPKKSIRNNKVIRRNSWKKKIFPQSSDEKKIVNNIYIGAGNAKRWIILKKKLDYQSDVDFVAFLLDLAEPHSGKCNFVDKLNDKEKRNDDDSIAVRDFEEETNGSTSSVTQEVSDDGEWCPAGSGHLRRSPRTQTVPLKIHVRRSSRNTLTEGDSDQKLYIEKKKKEKKVDSDTTEQEKSLELDTISHVEAEGQDSDTDVKLGKLSVTTDTLNNQICNSSEAENSERIEEQISEGSVNAAESSLVERHHNENEVRVWLNTGISTDPTEDKKSSNVTLSPIVVLEKSAAAKYSDIALQDDQDEVLIEVGERVKLKRRKKKKSFASDDQAEAADDILKPSRSDYSHGGKHRRKKHKHGDHSTKKKHHDIRKAPEDGFPQESSVASPQTETKDAAPNSTLGRDVCVKKETQDWVAPNDVEPKPADNENLQQQRVAIKIKMCCDCNSRHLQEACPLRNPLIVVNDSIIYEQWFGHRDQNGWTSAVIVSAASDGEERKPLIGGGNRQSFAEASLPNCLCLRVCDPEHGQGVVALTVLQAYTQFGPIVGQPIREMDIPDDFNMKDIWEIISGTERLYLSTQDSNSSNWLRYIRPAPSRELRNLVPIAREGHLYFITLVEIQPGEELLYWADDYSTSWSKKKMEKTNCGGCNLRFSHPLYYRMHCSLFHDPNFSLTIRKYHCKVCGTAVLGKENIMKHAAEMHDGKGAYQCQYCKKFFLRLNYLEMHRTYGCAANPQRARPLCDFCGRKFCQPQKLKVHIKRMHSDMAEVLREFQCKICLKLLGSRAALQRHMKEVHHKDIVGACTCDRCGKMFQNKSNLKIHMLTHSGVKPFRCKENGCTAAFTTKQCLQFHYKKVHCFSESSMPIIERSVAYTFDAYSGGIVEDPGRGKSPRFDKERRNSTDNNSSSLLSLDDSSTTSSAKADISGTSSAIDGNSGKAFHVTVHEEKVRGHKGLTSVATSPTATPHIQNINSYIQTPSYINKVVMSKGSKKWMGDSIVAAVPSPKREIYEFDDEKNIRDDINKVSKEESDRKVVFRRPESSNASLLVEAALDAAERDIDISGMVTSSAGSPTVITASEMVGNKQQTENIYITQAHLVNGTHHHHLDVSPSEVHHKTDTEGHIEGYLVSPATTPEPVMHHHQSSPPSTLQHMDNYTLQRVSPQCEDHTRSHHHHVYSIQHREDESTNPPPGYSIHHQQDEIMSPAGTPETGYSLHHQDDLVSPAGTPAPPSRGYELPHTDNMSSGDEGEVQNLSLGIKDKIDLVNYKQYETLDEFGRGSVERFEPLLVGSGCELHGLDMSARGYHHPPPHGFSRYHHPLYDDRQSVDLSRGGGYASPPPYSTHTEVLRVVSLDLTPGGGRHSVDLSIPRPPPGQQGLVERIISPPPHPGYHNYPSSPSPYHPPSRTPHIASTSPTTYHHYSGYY